MALVNITCPVTWWEQCKWIAENCPWWEDCTNWAAWQGGITTVWFRVSDEDAVAFNLIWGNKNPKNVSGL